MTLAVSETAAEAAAPAPRRRRWPAIVASVVVVLLVAAGTSAIVYAHTYSPLAVGNFSGPHLGQLRGVTDGVDDPSKYILVGPQGSTGTMSYSIANYGSRAVKILGFGLDPDVLESGEVKLSWSSPYDARGDILGGNINNARPLPATIAPGKQIAVYLTITKPQCHANETSEMIDIPLRTEALWVHHIWSLKLGGDGVPGPAIAVCFPKTALQHLTKN